MAISRLEQARIDAARDRDRLLAKHDGDPLARIAYRAEMFGVDADVTQRAVADALAGTPRATWAQIADALGLGADAAKKAIDRHAYWKRRRDA